MVSGATAHFRTIEGTLLPTENTIFGEVDQTPWSITRWMINSCVNVYTLRSTLKKIHIHKSISRKNPNFIFTRRTSGKSHDFANKHLYWNCEASEIPPLFLAYRLMSVCVASQILLEIVWNAKVTPLLFSKKLWVCSIFLFLLSLTKCVVSSIPLRTST